MIVGSDELDCLFVRNDDKTGGSKRRRGDGQKKRDPHFGLRIILSPSKLYKMVRKIRC